MARYYSDLNSPTNGDGLSWDTPFNTFRTAVGKDHRETSYG